MKSVCRLFLGSAEIIVLLLAGPGSAFPQTACESLASDVRLEDLSISAESAPDGWLATAPSSLGHASVSVPEHCAVTAIATPTADSRIQIQIWLPAAENRSGNLLGVGNGGYSSRLFLAQMADALRRGYAVAGSDTGHQGDDLSFGVGHPEKIRDWAYRSTHEMAQAARRVAAVNYNKSVAHRLAEQLTNVLKFGSLCSD